MEEYYKIPFIDLQWFAPEDEGKTEEPSEHKLRKLREEGRVAKSQELNGALVFFVGAILLLPFAPWIERKLEEMMVFFFQHVTAEKVDDITFLYVFLRYFLMMVLPFAFLGIVAAVVSNLIQNKGFIFTTKTISPKFSKIVPRFGDYFKRTMFSFQGVFNIAKSIIKVTVIAVVAFLIISSDMDRLLSALQTGGPMLALKRFAGDAAKMLIISAVILVGIGILDYFVQRRQFRQENKMTKQEVKQEFKDLEGDPDVKGHLEAAQKEMLLQNIPKAVKEADVVITNPTHYAVAVQWKRESSAVPQVTAKGEDMTAQNMKRIARENGVPTVENRPLARGLYHEVQVGEEVPDVYWRAIALVYAEIGYMEKKNKV
ncbi:MAG: flagellar biosynthesis protein FlhB [Treponema sp.]|nr:flagellar biosynthesis protein FlhB [Treponema sp.]MEE3313654.1 flagellar biosynthesis protein FlhB [Treponema sp.]